MLQLYSRGCEYALRCLSHLSESDCQNGFSAAIVCRRAGTPLWFSRKVFQSLARKGFLSAKRGPGGGYRFKVSLKEISILDVILAVDGKNALKKCAMQNSNCTNGHHCSLHPIWNKIRSGVTLELATATLDQFICHESNLERRK